MKVVPMQEKHLAAIAEIEKECFSKPWSEDALREELGKGVFLAAESGEKILGYAGCQTVLDEGYITNVAVSERFRKKGVGSALMRGMLEEAKKSGLSFLTLEVRASNLDAIRLYKKFGFKKSGVRRGYYDKPKEDAELWTLNL